jgi:hypothetical protein
VGGIVSMAAGAVAGDAVDRLLATHALNYINADGTNQATPSTSPANGSDNKPLFADVVPTSGSYQKLFNATAVLAPMNATRWLVGVGAPIAIYALSFAFSARGTARSVMQLGAFGWGVRTLLKGANQAAAALFGRTHAGARLYDAEARASAVQAANQPNGTDNTGNYPAAGLGRGRCDCPNCVAGVGACCAASMNQALANQQQPQGGGGAGGYQQPPQQPVQQAPQAPGAPVQRAPGPMASPGTPPPAPAPAPSLTRGSPFTNPLTQPGAWPGLRGVPARPRSPYEWSLVHEGQ